MDVFHLNDLVNEFKQWIEKALGVSAAEDAIKGLISSALDVVNEPLKKIESAVGADSIEETIKTVCQPPELNSKPSNNNADRYMREQFTFKLEDIRKDPMGTLVSIVGTSKLTKIYTLFLIDQQLNGRSWDSG